MGKIVTAAALLAASLAGAAAAQPVEVLVVQGGRAVADNQRVVPYGDLQLSSIADRRVLQKRVGLAIADLCDPSHFSVAEPQGSMACTRQAWTTLHAHLNQLTPRLAAR
jgi:UrcA family protein